MGDGLLLVELGVVLHPVVDEAMRMADEFHLQGHELEPDLKMVVVLMALVRILVFDSEVILAESKVKRNLVVYITLVSADLKNTCFKLYLLFRESAVRVWWSTSE